MALNDSSDRPSAKGPEAVVAEVVAAITRSGADILRVPTSRADEVHLLVRSRRDEVTARRHLDGGSWWLRLGGDGVWRATRTTRYLWNGGPTIHLDLGIPSWPMPRRALSRLERALWGRASADQLGGMVADEAGTYIFAAVQAARPGPARPLWLEALRESRLSEESRSSISALAAASGVGSAVASADRATRDASRLGNPLVDTGLWPIYWRIAAPGIRRIPSRRLRSLAQGAPAVSVTPTRTRFAGVEVEGGPGVFVPRTVTEDLLGLVLAEPPPVGAVVVEVGTGTGALALALASERPDLAIYAVDTSREAIRWARRNRKRLRASRVRFLRGSLLDPLPRQLAGSVDVIVSSVPYVAPGPWTGLDRYGSIEGTGQDGLDLVRALARDSGNVLRRGGRLVLQLGREQWPTFSEELRQLGYTVGEASGETASDIVAWASLGPRGRPSP